MACATKVADSLWATALVSDQLCNSVFKDYLFLRKRFIQLKVHPEKFCSLFMHFGTFKLITFLRIAKHKETWCFCRNKHLFLHFLFSTFIRRCFVISFWHICYTFSLISLRYTFLHYHVFDFFVIPSTIYVLFVTLPRMYMLLKISLKFSLQIVEITRIFHARWRESFSRFALKKKARYTERFDVYGKCFTAVDILAIRKIVSAFQFYRLKRDHENCHRARVVL